MESTGQAAVHARTFTYRTSTTWLDGRSGMLSSDGKPSIRVASPPEFKGEPNVWTPEDMFVASVEICHMATFISFAARQSLPVTSYRSHANGVLELVDAIIASPGS